MKQGRGGAGWRNIYSPEGRLEGRLADHPGDGASKEGKGVRRYVLSVTGASGIEKAKAAIFTDEASADSEGLPKAHGQLTLGELTFFSGLSGLLSTLPQFETTYKVVGGGNGGGLASRRDGIPISPATKSVPDSGPRSARPSTSSYPTTRLAPVPQTRTDPRATGCHFRTTTLVHRAGPSTFTAGPTPPAFPCSSCLMLTPTRMMDGGEAISWKAVHLDIHDPSPLPNPKASRPRSPTPLAWTPTPSTAKRQEKIRSAAGTGSESRFDARWRVGWFSSAVDVCVVLGCF
jgi:hypothetical protein